MLAEISVPMDINQLGEIALLMFFAMFIAIAWWTVTRSRQDVHVWSEIPLDNDRESEPQDRL